MPDTDPVRSDDPARSEDPDAPARPRPAPGDKSWIEMETLRGDGLPRRPDSPSSGDHTR